MPSIVSFGNGSYVNKRLLKPSIIISVIILTALAGLFTSWLVPNQRAHATNQRIITIFHDGQEQTVATEAETVEDVLKRAEITVNAHDAIEPSKDTKLVAANYNVNVYRARPVTVVDGGKRYQVMSPYQSPKKIAEHAGLQVVDEDILKLDRINDFLEEGSVGLKLTIDRSTPLNLMLYGKHVAAHTQAKTVGEFLKEKNVVLGPDDGATPSVNTPVTENMTLMVYRNGVQTVTEEKEVDFPIERIKDTERESSYREIKEPGTKGKKAVTYQIELRDGKEVSRKEIQSVTTVQPKKQVEVVGAKPTFSGSFGDALAKLRACESGGNYANKRNPMYRGAYQFGYQTWANYGGYYDPADAPPAVQDQAAFDLYKRRGWQPWPHCGANLPDTYR